MYGERERTRTCEGGSSKELDPLVPEMIYSCIIQSLHKNGRVNGKDKRVTFLTEKNIEQVQESTTTA